MSTKAVRPAAVRAVNLIKNPSFELGSDGLPLDWTVLQVTGGGTAPAKADDFQIVEDDQGRKNYVDKDYTRLSQDLDLSLDKKYKLEIGFKDVLKDRNQWAAHGGVTLGFNNGIHEFSTREQEYLVEYTIQPSDTNSYKIEIGNLDHYRAHHFTITSISLVEIIEFGEELILNGDFINASEHWVASAPDTYRFLSGDGKSFLEVRTVEVIASQEFQVEDAGLYNVAVDLSHNEQGTAPDAAFVQLNDGQYRLPLAATKSSGSFSGDFALSPGVNKLEIVVPAGFKRIEVDKISVRARL
ncbi:hypothetical protein [Limoniibacter endophyticus]|uniref:Uncharacterized protein n=1 Tax=Limoniibacter endophyticus TaxID=1565040 RepID=A0A8J3DI79_9HYPH|nr:hypothetical protein [Limoniibacter endophyticus]GHC69407.1 hypothetical protein GCM10010136_15210 [Limoniibacter endophyticus]